MLRFPATLIFLLLILSGAFSNQACGDPMPAGVFIDKVILYHDPQGQIHNESPPESMKGLPDGAFVDLDGGGTTVAFSQTPVEYDWRVELADDTQLILVDMGPGRDDGPAGTELALSFGYGIPVDNGDGVAGNATGKARFLGWEVFNPIPMRGAPVRRLLFYAFDETFHGVTPDFYLSVDDARDQEVDAVFIFE